MACENKRQLPINIKKSGINQYSRNLSQFFYDFKDCKSITVEQHDKDISGFAKFNLHGIENSYINFSTMGSLKLKKGYIIVDSINKYDGERKNMEIILEFEKTVAPTDTLIMIIPVEKSGKNTASSSFFHAFIPFMEEKKEGKKYESSISVQGLNINNLIPTNSFLLYNAVFPLIYTCEDYYKTIIFNESIQIKDSDYNKLDSIFGNYRNNDLNTEANQKKELHSSNYTEMHNINYRMMYYNKKGTKHGPGRHGDLDIQNLTCTPILDEDDQPIDGTRLDWIKQAFDEGVSTEFKTIIFVIILVGLTVVILVTVHEYAFKSIGKLIGDESIVGRSSSNL